MDENEYKSIRNKLMTEPCAFEKSILGLKTRCPKSTKKNIAEREVVMCASPHYAARCNSWLVILRRKSQFSLHVSEQATVLPHSKEMKVQAGGILGLCKILEIEIAESNSQPNVFEALEVCHERIAKIESLPFTEIIREIVHFRPR